MSFCTLLTLAFIGMFASIISYLFFRDDLYLGEELHSWILGGILVLWFVSAMGVSISSNLPEGAEAEKEATSLPSTREQNAEAEDLTTSEQKQP